MPSFLFVKTTDFQLVLILSRRVVTIFGEHYFWYNELLYHDGEANQSSRITLSNDSVFNYNSYQHFLVNSVWYRGVRSLTGHRI